MNLLQKLPENSVLGLGVFLLVLLLVILTKKLYEHRGTNPAVLKKGALCVKRASEEAVIAQQVKNPLLALTRANYALAYINIARDLALDDELSQATQIHFDELREDVEKQERRARDRVLKLCPQLGVNTRAGAGAGSGYFHEKKPDQSQTEIRTPIAAAVENDETYPYRNQRVQEGQASESPMFTRLE